MAYIQSDHDGEFHNKNFIKFVIKMTLSIFFYFPQDLQENWIVEKKTRFLEELVRMMLHKTNLPKYF